MMTSVFVQVVLVARVATRTWSAFMWSELLGFRRWAAPYIVVGPFSVGVVAFAKAAHAPLGASIAHAYVYFFVMGGDDAVAVPLRVGVG